MIILFSILGWQDCLNYCTYMGNQHSRSFTNYFCHGIIWISFCWNWTHHEGNLRGKVAQAFPTSCVFRWSNDCTGNYKYFIKLPYLLEKTTLWIDRYKMFKPTWMVQSPHLDLILVLSRYTIDDDPTKEQSWSRSILD